MKEDKKAIQQIEKALKIDPDNIDIKMHYIEVIGENIRSEIELQKIIELSEELLENKQLDDFRKKIIVNNYIALIKDRNPDPIKMSELMELSQSIPINLTT